MKTVKASKASNKGVAAKTAASQASATSNDNTDTPISSRVVRAKSGKKPSAVADVSDEEVKDEEGDDGPEHLLAERNLAVRLRNLREDAHHWPFKNT